MKKFLILILILNCSVALALNENEKKLVIHAKGALSEAQKNYNTQKLQAEQAEKRAEEAEKEAEEANKNAAQTAQNILTLQGDIKKASAREAKLVIRVNNLQRLEKKVNSLWGIGAIIYGFERLAKHIFILIAVLIGLALILWVVSFFVPWLKPLIGIFNNILTAILNFIKNLFKRK
jgi:phage-related protein